MWSFVTKNKNDIIYLSLLLFSVVIGPYYRRLNNVESKKWAGSLLGILLIIIVSGYSAAHPILSAIFGITAIKYATVKRCHVVTFFFMFGYLMVFRLSEYFGLPPNSGQTNLIEMIIVLRVVGVAFEINGSYLAMKKLKRLETKMDRLDQLAKENNEDNAEEKDATEKDEKEKDKKAKDKHAKNKQSKEKGLRQRKIKEKELRERKMSENSDDRKDFEFMELINPEFIDLFHYCFNYIGLLTGPYYRYRTFDDYFRLPFSKHVDCFGFTVNTLKTVPLYISLYLAFSNIWPLEYILTEEHNNRCFLYRMMYPWALFAAFRQRIYAGMTLAESVCTSAGLGAYPVQGRNRSGHGPTVGYLRLKRMSDEEAKKSQYDFTTVESMDVWGCETVATLRDSMKVWNKAVQYWVAMVVYKRFPVKPLNVAQRAMERAMLGITLLDRVPNTEIRKRTKVQDITERILGLGAKLNWAGLLAGRSNDRIHAALFVSVIWHGYHAGYFFCIYACPFYLMAEDIYNKMFYKNATGIKKKIIGFIMWFLRSHSESYQAAAFLLLTFDRIWKYYSSMHHYWYACWLVFLIIGLLLKKIHKLLHIGNREQGNEDQNQLLANEPENDNGTAENEEGLGNDNEGGSENSGNVKGAGNDNKDKIGGNKKDQVEKDNTGGNDNDN